MDRQAFVAGIIPAFFLYACGQSAPIPSSDPGSAPAASVPPAAASSGTPPSPDPTGREGPPAGYTDGSGINEGYPDLTPIPLTPEAERTETGATNVLQSFARAIELKEFDQAWALLPKAEQAKWPKAEFTRLFAGLEKIAVAFAGGSMEGAAGSSYYTAPLTITASDADGRPIRYEGQAVLRRVNDVPGATPAQLRWRFEKVTLDWTH